jgi:hypothetical protein
MNPVKFDFEIWQGKTFEKIFYFKDGNDNITLLNGYTARMQLRTALEAAEIAIELNTENNRIIINGDDGSVTLFIDPEDTAELPIGSYKYDLELITASSRVYGPLYGKIKVKGEVTR